MKINNNIIADLTAYRLKYGKETFRDYLFFELIKQNKQLIKLTKDLLTELRSR